MTEDQIAVTGTLTGLLQRADSLQLLGYQGSSPAAATEGFLLAKNPVSGLWSFSHLEPNTVECTLP